MKNTASVEGEGPHKEEEEGEGGDRSVVVVEPTVEEEVTASGTGIDRNTKSLEVEELIVVVVVGGDPKKEVAVAAASRIGSPFDSILGLFLGVFIAYDTRIVGIDFDGDRWRKKTVVRNGDKTAAETEIIRCKAHGQRRSSR